MKFNCTMKLKVYAIILTGSSRSIQFNSILTIDMAIKQLYRNLNIHLDL